MPRPPKRAPERGDARHRLLEAARDLFRAGGYAGTSIDALCAAAGVSKGAFFHHFESKDALGVAAADFWGETTSALFRAAPYHEPETAVGRVLAYVDFRRALIQGTPAEFGCLAGTLVQEVHASAPTIREACGRAIFGHADTLVADIAAALRERGIEAAWSAASLARHTQAVLQGAFILAKASNDITCALESVDHLRRYLELLFGIAAPPQPRRTIPEDQHRHPTSEHAP